MENGTGKRRLRFGTVTGTVLLLIPVVYFFAHPEYCQDITRTVEGVTMTERGAWKIAAMILFPAAGLAALWVPCRLSEKRRKLLGILGFFLTGVVSIFALEYANIWRHRTPPWVLREIGPKKLFLTWTIVFLFSAWFAVLVNRWQMASVLTAACVCIFGVVCYYVYALRGEAFLASDLTTLQTAANVAGGYDYRMDSCTLVLVMFTIAWSDVVLWTGKTRIFSGWKWRVAFAFCGICVTLLYDRVYLHTEMLRHRGVVINTFRPEKSYGKNGAILTFLRSIQMMIVEEPEGYSVKRVEEIEAAYPAEEGKKAGEASFQPNVLFIMDEAFTDMQSWMDFETDQEACPFFSGLKENTIRGKLYVSSYGGRTANTEYEVMTGDSMGFLPPGSTPYQQYIKNPMPGLNSALENEGYRHTVGMHPFRPTGYDRAKAYEMFGFDHLLFLDDFAGAETIYGRVSDHADIERVIREYEAAKAESDAPFFLYNVTMQNHSPYLRDLSALSDPVHLTDGDYPDVDVYLSLIRKSDEALEELVRYFEQIEDPTVIVFFGDHQPSLDDGFYQMVYGKTMSQMEGEELMQFYHSSYLIWANFDIREMETDLSTNYLAPFVKQACGMELTGYDRFLLHLREDLPVVSLHGYLDRDGVFYDTVDDKKSPWYDRLQEYRMLTYNHLFDRKNRNDAFFGGSVPEGGT